MDKISVQIIIKGRVQNVGFRYHTRQKALELGIFGFVKNMPNGTVYCEAEGKQLLVSDFIEWCKKGPTWAKVTSINTQLQPLCNYSVFDIM